MLQFALESLARADRNVNSSICALLAEIVREKDDSAADGESNQRNALASFLWQQCSYAVLDAILSVCPSGWCCVLMT